MTDSVRLDEPIDRYFVARRLLARGGMSDIHEVEHSLTGRRMALKLLPADKRKNQEMRGRLLREAQILELARGEGVVDLITAGECPIYGPYIVMEKLVGRPLDGLIVARGSLRPEEALRVFVPLANTLARLHEMNIIHRDIKPANVFVAVNQPSAKYAVKLLDFGVSTRLDPQAEQSKLTFAGELLGTVEYMPPEQVVARHDQVDARSDIFSFGASLFEALTGVLPLGNDPFARYRAVQSNAVAPSLSNLVPDLNPALAQLVGTLLSFEKKDRPRSLRDVVLALNQKAGAMAIPPLGTGGTATPPLAPVQLPPGAEQRKNARASYITAVKMSSDTEAQDCRSEDISAGGMLVLSKKAHAAGAKVQLRFAAPMSGNLVQTAAIVRWHKVQNGRAALGLEWIDAPRELVSEVAEYLRYMRVPTQAD